MGKITPLSNSAQRDETRTSTYSRRLTAIKQSLLNSVHARLKEINTYNVQISIVMRNLINIHELVSETTFNSLLSFLKLPTVCFSEQESHRQGQRIFRTVLHKYGLTIHLTFREEPTRHRGVPKYKLKRK